MDILNKTKSAQQRLKPFILFLKKKRLFHLYRYNLRIGFPESGNRQPTSSKDLMHGNFELITDAFHWRSTKQGHDFWCKLADEYYFERLREH